MTHLRHLLKYVSHMHKKRGMSNLRRTEYMFFSLLFSGGECIHGQLRSSFCLLISLGILLHNLYLLFDTCILQREVRVHRKWVELIVRPRYLLYPMLIFFVYNVCKQVGTHFHALIDVYLKNIYFKISVVFLVPKAGTKRL